MPLQQDEPAVALLRLALERHHVKHGTAQKCLDHPFFEPAWKEPRMVDTTSTLAPFTVNTLSELKASSRASEASNFGSELSATTRPQSPQ